MALETRPPIITIMGHVDHGKTTLLDYIRKSRLQSKEVGGITQHIGAYQIDFETKDKKKKKITFIDTPGHSAFNKMRQRGAQITDIVILVVAADDGVKPQTVESIRYIKESKVPFLVAINKIDLKNIQPNKVESELAAHEVVVREYGGDVDVVKISAKTGKGVDELLETVSLMAELQDFKADPDAPLEAVVIESTKDSKRGSVASVIVKQGTLTQRQNIISSNEVKGRVRLLTNDRSMNVKLAKPGTPVEIIGFRDVPEVGEFVYDEDNLSTRFKKEDEQTQDDQQTNRDEWDIEALLDDKEKIKLIIKADVKGTLEAITQTLDEESIELVSSGVGLISETDLELAETSNALIINFHQKLPKNVKAMAKRMGVKIKQYDIIYHLLEDLEKKMLKFLEPTIDEVVTGEAEILDIFEINNETIAGIKVKTGEIKKNDLLHLKRNDEILVNPVIKSMKHGKDDILVVKTKNEAGLTFKNKKLDFKKGDLIVAYKKEE